MASRANIQIHILRSRRADIYLIATPAFSFQIIIVWVNLTFHLILQYYERRRRVGVSKATRRLHQLHQARAITKIMLI